MPVPTGDFDPARTALLVMDYQSGILSRIADAESLLTRVAETIGRLRSSGTTIGFVRIAFSEDDLAAFPATNKMAPRLQEIGKAFLDSSPNTAIHERIRPGANDIVVRKTRVGAFSTTDLDDRLRSRGIDTLLLAGLTTSGVVLSTVRDAADRDYRIMVVADLCADHDAEAHELLTGRLFLSQAGVLNAVDLQSG